jgi:hypothetical protein
MRKSVAALTLALVGLHVGCDSSNKLSPVSAPPPGPHHGIMLGLPSDKGFVELANEPEISDRRKPEPTSIVVYFLQRDAKSPLSPAPTDVRFAIEGGEGKGARTAQTAAQSVALTPESKPDDVAAAGRFASKLGPYGLEGLRGTLTAKIDGESIAIPVSGGR